MNTNADADKNSTAIGAVPGPGQVVHACPEVEVEAVIVDQGDDCPFCDSKIADPTDDIQTRGSPGEGA